MISPTLVAINAIPDHDERRAAWTEYYVGRIEVWKADGTLPYELTKRYDSATERLGNYVFEKDTARTEALTVLRAAYRLSEGAEQ
jgi:hypothetical protein